MIGRKRCLVILLTVVFLSSLITMISISSTTESNSEWADINDDNTVDIFDAILLSSAYGQTGGHINKTELLLQCNATYTSLMSRMDYLNASFIDLLAVVEGMNATNLLPLINDLNSSLIQVQSKVAALGTTVTQLQASNSSAWAALAQLQGQFNSINSTLSTRVSNLENVVATMSTTIAAMTASLIAQQSQIDSLNATLASLISRIDNLESTNSSMIFSNSTYSTSSTLTSEAYSWIDMAGMSVTLNVSKTSRLFIMFSVTNAYCINGPDEYSTISIQAVANSTQAMPGQVTLIPMVQVQGFAGLMSHAHSIRGGAYSFDFSVSSLPAGMYTIKIQWRVSATSPQCTGYVGYRSLSVMAIST